MTRSQSKGRSADAFFKRHGRLFSFTGAVIVFSTFVVKEGLAERWSEEARALDLAEYVYLIREDTLKSLDYSIQVHNEALLRSNHAVGLDFLTEPYFDMYVAADASELNELYSLGIALDNISTLLEKVSRLSPAQIDVTKLQERVQNRRKLLSNEYLFHLRLQAAAKQGKSKDELRGIWDDEETQHPDEFAPNQDHVGRISDDCRQLFSKVVGEVEEERKSSDRRSSWAWWIAAGLYALGWGLAVIGRVFSVPMSGEQ